MSNRTLMTVAGEAALREELHRLKSVERPRLSAAIAEARALGDLKENAEYHAAREQQGLNEARIRDIEGKLSQAQVVDIAALDNKGKVAFGFTVSLTEMEAGKSVKYQIVGADEANISQGKLSVESPLGSQLLGKELGDTLAIDAPGGTIEYTVDAIEQLT